MSRGLGIGGTAAEGTASCLSPLVTFLGLLFPPAGNGGGAFIGFFTCVPFGSPNGTFGGGSGKTGLFRGAGSRGDSVETSSAPFDSANGTFGGGSGNTGLFRRAPAVGRACSGRTSSGDFGLFSCAFFMLTSSSDRKAGSATFTPPTGAFKSCGEGYLPTCVVVVDPFSTTSFSLTFFFGDDFGNM